MFCSNCSKLSTKHTQKSCVSCTGSVTLSIAVLCDSCSSTNNKCSACLKRLSEPAHKRPGGCSQCGRK